MKGTVKWYSNDKGFGFISGEDSQDYWFHISVMPADSRPVVGDAVEFSHEMGPKGPRATRVTPLGGATSGKRGNAHAHNARTTCTHCGKSMIPRIVTGPPLIHGKGSWTPVPKYSLCPFCGNRHQSFPPSTAERVGQILLVGVLAAVVIYVGFRLIG